MTRRAHRQRGAAYVFVLITASIITLIGLSSLTVSRIQAWELSTQERTVRARVHAQSAVDLALQRISQDANWRSTYTHDVWTSPEAFGNASLQFKLVDQVDTDLSNDSSHAARLVVKAAVGGAARLYSVLVESVHNTNLLSNPGFESGLADWSAWACTTTINGSPNRGSFCLLQTSRSLSQSEAYQDITSVVENGQPYYVEVWAKTVSGTETLKIDLKTQASGSGAQNFQTASVVVGTTWTKISGVVTPTWTGTLTDARWRVFSWADGGTAPFFTDDAGMAVAAVGPDSVQVIPGSWRREVD